MLALSRTCSLRENLFGLELDPRCSQIAAFNLALTAWKLAGSHFDSPPLNVACSGLGINAREEDWVKLAGGDDRIQGTMRKLFNIFSNAPSLGSLIDPSRIGATRFVAEFREVRPLLEKALADRQFTDESRELACQPFGTLVLWYIGTYKIGRTYRSQPRSNGRSPGKAAA